VLRLLPGDCAATAEDMILTTVLGSCVAACLRDPVRGIGGMNHFLLPDDGGRVEGGRSPRYGLHAMALLIDKLRALGAQPDLLEAHVFGGGHIVQTMTAFPIGARNARFVLDYLTGHGIRVLTRDLEGRRARKVSFHVRSGRTEVEDYPPGGNSRRS
jgi:chemotaxis protein CheD